MFTCLRLPGHRAISVGGHSPVLSEGPEHSLPPLDGGGFEHSRWPRLDLVRQSQGLHSPHAAQDPSTVTRHKLLYRAGLVHTVLTVSTVTTYIKRDNGALQLLSWKGSIDTVDMLYLTCTIFGGFYVFCYLAWI